MLLAKREPQNSSANWNSVVHPYYIIAPSDSATLLLKAVATRELLLPSTFPALPAEHPERARGAVEVSGRQRRERAGVHGQGPESPSAFRRRTRSCC